MCYRLPGLGEREREMLLISLDQKRRRRTRKEPIESKWSKLPSGPAAERVERTREKWPIREGEGGGRRLSPLLNTVVCIFYKIKTRNLGPRNEKIIFKMPCCMLVHTHLCEWLRLTVQLQPVAVFSQTKKKKKKARPTKNKIK